MDPENKAQESDLETQHRSMLEEALRRPGVREAMEVYGHCQPAVLALQAFYDATTQLPNSTTTDHANID